MSNCQGFWIQRKLEEQEQKLNRRLDDLERAIRKLREQLHGVDVLVSGIHRELGTVRDLADRARVWTE
jgi:hypothetical protein